jgi:hypothetical protein
MHDPARISDLTLERYALGELPAAERRALEALAEADPALRGRLRALEDSNAAILRETPPELFAQRLRARQRRRAAEDAFGEARRAASPKFSLRGWKPLAGSLVVISLVSLVAVSTSIRNPGAGAVGADQPVEIVRIKGLEPHLAIFRKTGDGAEPLLPGEKARPGELLRIGYQAGGFPYGAILSVDGNGSVTRHWPSGGGRAGRLEKGETLLPSSFELDAAPDFERFYFVVSERPFDIEPLLDSLHEHESLSSAAAKTRIVRFEVLKENGI